MGHDRFLKFGPWNRSQVHLHQRDVIIAWNGPFWSQVAVTCCASMRTGTVDEFEFFLEKCSIGQ